MTTDEFISCSQKYIMGTYNRVPIVLEKGAGVKVWDHDGKEYLDFVAGIAVCSLGHSHPKVVEAIRRQSEKLTHVSNLYHIVPQIQLARLLVEHAFHGKVFFCNSGAEANEAAIKIARKYAYENRDSGKSSAHANKYEIITMLNSFHGRTMATITATGQRKFQVGFDPLLDGFTYVPFNDPEAIRGAITEKTCGVMLEPIQGEGGVLLPDREYLRKVRNICDEHKILLILDEVQVGMGRTGTLFSYEDYGIEPDIMTLAKALGNGFPVGAMMAKNEVASVFVPGTHASTFGGNPLGMAAALATVEAILEDGILENCRKMGSFFMSKLEDLRKKHAMIREVRGKGLIIGVELADDASMQGPEIVNQCRAKGLLMNCTSNNVLRFVPPLIVTEHDIMQGVHILDEVMEEGK